MEKKLDEHNISDEELYVQKNVSYYLEVFFDIEKKGNKYKWNWASFFFGPLWCFYRKLYLIGIIAIVVYHLFEILAEVVTQSLPIGIAMAVPVTLNAVIIIIPAIAMGMLGNYFYKRSFDKHVMNKNSKDGTMHINYLSSKGGTNVGAVVLGVILLILYDAIQIYMRMQATFS